MLLLASYSVVENLVSCWTVTEVTSWALDDLLLGDGDDVDWDGVELLKDMSVREERRVGRVMVTYTERLEEILGIGINLELTSLAL